MKNKTIIQKLVSLTLTCALMAGISQSPILSAGLVYAEQNQVAAFEAEQHINAESDQVQPDANTTSDQLPPGATPTLTPEELEILAPATDDYTGWKQYSINWKEETPWPRGRRFGAAACWITSLAMLLRQYDIVTEPSVEKFNPLICNSILMEHGIVIDTGDYINSGVEKIFNAFPGIYYVADVPYSFDTLKSLYDQGFICIVHENRGHYVAVREVTDTEVVIMDPGYKENELTSSNFIQYFSTDPVYTAKGKVSSLTAENGILDIEGWVYDLQDPAQTATVGITVGAPLGEEGILAVYTAPAEEEFEKLGIDYPDAGPNHAFHITFRPGCSGQVPVYVYALTLGDEGKCRLIHSENVVFP